MSNSNVEFNIARCYEKLNNFTQAYNQYSSYLVLETDETRRAAALASMARIEGQVALIEVITDPPGATLYADRKNLGARGAAPRNLAVAPGERRIIAELSGHADADGRIEAIIGRKQVILLTLDQHLGAVVLDGGPDGAVVRLSADGEPIGTVPGSLNLPPGPQLLYISAAGHLARQYIAQVSLEEPIALAVSLEPLTGSVLVEAPERGAQIRIDGEIVGYAPSVLDVPLGSHEVEVSLSGFRPWRQTITVEPDDNPTLEARMLAIRDVTAASGIKESLTDAPATMVIVTAEDIASRGYTDLPEVIRDLPGFDVVVANGTTYITAYQRGYRTPFTQRTLLMINGITDNHLWTHEAVISRQYPLSNIERIEVLYGPASAVYGANAFLGIINIVTKDARMLEPGSQDVQLNAHLGSYSTRAVDASLQGRTGELSYTLTGRVFRSDEADLSQQWGFLSNDLYADPDIWGPILDLENYNVPYGSYQDPTDDWGVVGEVGLQGLSVGVIAWDRKEAYGPYYVADRAQNNALWNKSSRQIYARYSKVITDNLTSRTLLLSRESRVWGGWVEGAPDAVDSSFISITNWQSLSNSWLFQETMEYRASDRLQLLSGVKFERKELTKSYELPGYWEGSYTSLPIEEESAIGHSTDETYSPGPLPPTSMGNDNLALTEDLGGFALGIYDLEPFRFNVGIRYDDNSLYGSSINPRASAIWKFNNEQGALKLLVGEAFQEPAPIQLWGGWEGRAANPNLKPEHARNHELVAMYRTARIDNELSAYHAIYENVIKEEAENAGERLISGVEYRGRMTLDNPIPESDKITLFANYTFTHAISSIDYDHDAAAWVTGSVILGDIAPHKINAGITVPVWPLFRLHLRGNRVGERTLYARNPLSNQGETIDPYLLLTGVLSLTQGPFTASLKINNLTDAVIFHPGVESASAGNDFSTRSTGYHNSLLPQAGRNALLTAKMEF